MCEENQGPDELDFLLFDAVLPSPNQEIVRHILLGDYGAIARAIKTLAVCNYAYPQDWSQPIPTGRSGEYLSIMTKREAPGSAMED
jgi:hypothetical protein